MRYSNFFAIGAISAVLLLGGVPTARAQERYGYGNGYGNGYGYDNRGDWARVQRLRQRIAEDRFRMEENRRRGRWRAAQRDERDLARHEYELDRLFREMRRDRADAFRHRR